MSNAWNPCALFVRHKALPGKRDEVRAVWERWVKPRIEENPDHLAYYLCYDNDDPDRVCVFQLYRDREAMNRFLTGAWYPEYLKEVAEFVDSQPELTSCAAVWIKGQ